jgi:hypothetical protein
MIVADFRENNHKMSKKTTIGHGPILETAKRIVERTVF